MSHPSSSLPHDYNSSIPSGTKSVLGSKELRILIVEDDDDSRLVMETALAATGYHTSSAINGAQGLLLCRSQPPDLILSDILMPEMDGFEFCRQVKIDTHLKDIPFIFYTATFVEDLDRDLALELGASQFLVKPMDPMDIIAIISETLQKESVPQSRKARHSETHNPVLDAPHLERLNAKLIQKIKELEEKHQALEESTRYNRLLFEQSPVGLVLCEMDGTLVDINPAYADILGRSIEETLRLTNWDITPEIYAEQEQRQLQSLKGTGCYGPYEKEYIHQQGYLVPVRLSGMLLKKDGKEYIWSSVENISLQRAAEQELEKHREHLEELVNERTRQLKDAYQELESFSYSVSHDLRTPLRAINGFSQILLEDRHSQVDEQTRTSLQRIHSASQRMGELIDDLLALSNLSRTEIRWNSVDMSQLCTEITTTLQQDNPERKAHIRIQPGVIVRGDAALLRIVLENLLGNAWKYTSRKTCAEIEFGSLEEDGVVNYFIRDNGIGIDMNYADKLFLPFYRLQKAEDYEGSGIGLATVSRVLHRHGGTIRVHGEPGVGSTFIFNLNENALMKSAG